MAAADYRSAAAAVRAAGLTPRGAFHCKPDDEVPPLPDGRPARTLLLVGNAGGALWPVFAASSEARDGRPDPLNRWSQRVVGGLAAALGGQALYPFGGPPYLPFQRWALRTEAVAPSPLGILIHPVYGLWHAYRGALAFAAPFELPPPETAARPCDSCAGKPCLGACPVAAFDGTRYDVAACATHIAAPAGADCMALGCAARRACPVGRDYLYEAEQARFHMAAFLRARPAGET